MTGSTKKQATLALVLLTALNFVNYIDRYILPAVQEQVKGEFHLSDAQLGALTMWFMVAYIAVSPLTGWLGDRFPRKQMIVVCALLIAACNFFTAHVSSYDSLNFRHAMLGIGEASFGIFAPALLADFYAREKRNLVMTIFNIALPVGSAIGYLTGGLIGHHHGWRMAFIVSAAPGVLIALLILFFMREPERLATKDRTGVERGTVLALLKNKAYLAAILGYAAVTFSLGGISVWMPSFLQRMNGYTEAEAAGAMGPIIVVAGLGGTVLGGVIAQRWVKRTGKALYLVPSISALLTAPVALACFFGPKQLTLPSLAAAVFLIFMGTGPVNAATLNSVAPNMRAAAMAGQLLAIHLLGDTFSPRLIGMISDRSNLRIGLSVTLVTFVLGAAIFYAGTWFAPSGDRACKGCYGCLRQAPDGRTLYSSGFIKIRMSGLTVSVLDLVGMRPEEQAREAIARSVKLAQHVEALGYKRFWLAEHHSIAGLACSATSVLIGHVAAATKTIRVGSGGVMLPNHAPLVVAEQFGTLDALYPGRIDLGLGRAPGGDFHTMRALRRDLKQTGDEFPQLLEELRTYLGDGVPGQVVHAYPGEGSRVPITLLGSSGFSAQLAGLLGLPFAFAAHFAPEYLLAASKLYREIFRPGVLQKPYMMAAVQVIAAETDAEARRLFTTPQQRFLRLIRNQPVELLPPVDSMEGLWADYERAAVESKLGAAIAGSPETVKAGLQKLVAETGAQEVIVVTDTYALEDRMKSYEIVSEVAKTIQ